MSEQQQEPSFADMREAALLSIAELIEGENVPDAQLQKAQALFLGMIAVELGRLNATLLDPRRSSGGGGTGWPARS